MSKRWISLYVENDIGVLAKIAGLFAGKLYNLESLTVGETLDTSVSRMTLCVNSDDATFEQVKKQLNRIIEVIKVVDLFKEKVYSKEILYFKITEISEPDVAKIFRFAETYGGVIVYYGINKIIMEFNQTEEDNNETIQMLQEFVSEFEIVRGGSVAIEV